MQVVIDRLKRLNPSAFPAANESLGDSQLDTKMKKKYPFEYNPENKEWEIRQPIKSTLTRNKASIRNAQTQKLKHLLDRVQEANHRWDTNHMVKVRITNL